MLTDDELDFDDFGDLGEVGGTEITNEELEKQLELEFGSEEDVIPYDASTTHVELEEGETNEATSDKEEGEAKEDKTKPKPDEKVEASSKDGNQKNSTKQTANNQQKFNKNYHNKFNNPYNYPFQYPMNYLPGAFAMNNMFPPYPQFSNRIYINPKFSNTGANPQQMMQQQQQQRQFMEMEAQRMIMLQQQMQMQHQQEKQRMAELDQKRRETAENIRKRKEAKEQLNGEKSKSQLGEKRDRNETDVEVNDRQSKRQETMTSSNEGGISIKGAASRVHHHSSLPPRNIPYTPPHYSQRRDEYISKNKEQHPYHSPPNRNDIRNRLNLSSENITSRLNKSTNSSNKNSPVSIVATPVVPISTNGKSNVVIIQGLSSNTKEEEIKKLTNSIPGGANEIKLDVNLKTATVIFPTVESAVTFRRKYNRIQMGDSHINITFQKIK